MPLGKVDFYLLQQQGQMKKVSYSIEDQSFNVHQYQYKIDRIYGVGSMPTEFGKNVLIANQILYKSGIIDPDDPSV